MNPSAEMLLNELNAAHLKLHRAFEEAFWLFKMGDHAVKDAMNDAEKARDAFRADARNLEHVRAAISASATSPKEIERSEEHTSELQSRLHLVCRLLLEKKKKKYRLRRITSHQTDR